ncbi:MAG: 2-iminobutanoate/2-iminopropanoate deaminase [Chlamydiales bacterium]|jgi:2-iminobutanoate/2-iminopropanoate deaminase
MSLSFERIATEKAPKALGPYSQATSVDLTNSRLLFVSGQLPIIPETGKMISGDIIAMTHQILDNLDTILKEGGSSMRSVLRVDVFMKDLNDFEAFNEVYGMRFTGPKYPARQTVQVEKLPLDSPIEISCIAFQETGK